MTKRRSNASIIGPQQTTSASAAPGVHGMFEHRLARTLGNWPGVDSDPNFRNVGLRLTGDGFNGVTNNSFLDSGQNNFAVNRTGNVAQGSFTPFGSSWSTYFDGTGDFLGTSNRLNLTGDYTMECWFYCTNTSLTFNMLFGQGNLYVGIAASGFRLSFSDGAYPDVAATFNSNTWYHIAIVRSGMGTNNISCYVNGVRVGQFTNTSAPLSSSSTATLAIGQQGQANHWYFNGLISNLRIVDGTAVYASAFTPPTSPLTAIPGTVLLCCHANRFVDGGSGNIGLTRNGDARVTRFSPFSLSEPYTSQFDGTKWSTRFSTRSDTVNIPNSASIHTFTGDFTIECWVCPADTSLSSTWGIIDARSGGGTAGSWIWCLSNTTTDGWILNFYTGSSRFGGLRVPASAWTHVAVVRSGTTLRYYVNGVQDPVTFTLSGTITGGGAPVIGSKDSSLTSYGILGSVSNLRIVNGTAVYTRSFTPPTAPLTAITNTTLLTCNGPTIADGSASGHALTTTGTVSTSNFFINSDYVDYARSSVTFNGSSRAVYDSHTAFDMWSGNATVEFWVNFSSIANSPHLAQFGTSDTYRLNLYLSGGTIRFYSRAGSGGADRLASSSVVTGTWYHVALTKSGSTFTLWLNGVSQGSVATEFPVGLLTFCAGHQNFSGGTGDYFNGQMSNLRLVKGTALYTSAFTPPTAPLTAVSGTSLLTCSSSGSSDLSANNFAPTITGTLPRTTLNPFGAIVPATTTTIYNAGSAYFDGSGDYLSAAHSTTFNLDNSDATIEAWVYPTSTDATARGLIVHATSVASWQGWQLTWQNQKFNIETNNTASTGLRLVGSTVPLNAWSHVALVKSGTTFTLYVNGANQASGTSSLSTDAAVNLYVGADRSLAGAFSGYISGVRVQKGTALYTTTFTPPITPPSPTATTQLLLNFSNAAVVDTAGQSVIETVGDARVSTAVVKYGSGALYFDGTGDRVVMPSTPALLFGTGDFTFEAWVYLTGFGSYPRLFCIGGFQTAGNFQFEYNSTSILIHINNTTTSFSTTLTTGVWYHWAVTRQNGSVRVFVNGAQIGTTQTIAGIVNNTSMPTLGANVDGTAGHIGYIDDVRITNGVARYTSSFTPPARALPTF